MKDPAGTIILQDTAKPVGAGAFGTYSDDLGIGGTNWSEGNYTVTSIYRASPNSPSPAVASTGFTYTSAGIASTVDQRTVSSSAVSQTQPTDTSVVSAELNTGGGASGNPSSVVYLGAVAALAVLVVLTVFVFRARHR